MGLSRISETVKIFFSLAPAPQDENLFNELRKHLISLKRRGWIDMWYDSAISAGSNVQDIITSYMNTADIIVLLISADFFNSEQCFEVEMQYALGQQEAHVIPVLLRPTEWRGFALEQYKLLPSNGEAVSIWDNLDSALKEVAEGIRTVVEKIKGQLTSKHLQIRPPRFPLYMLPHRRNPCFTDREELLTALHHYFTSEQTGQTRTQALYGPGGVGKTLLAIEYAGRYQHAYQAVLWLNAASRESLSADMLSLAQQLGISARDSLDEQQRFNAIKHWLQRHDRWLLVLDNLEDFHITNQFIPSQSSGHVLLITHSAATGQFAYAVSVTQMTIHEGALLLLRRAKIIPERGSRDAALEKDYLDAIAIAQEFEGYPLALDQAGAYIEETRRSLASYLTLYREQQATLLGIRGRLADDHPDPVTTTFALIFEKIAQIDPAALELLRFLAFLYPDALPDEMLRDGAMALNGPLRALATDSIALDAALATLRRFSLVHHSADTTTLNMHRIIQAIIKRDLTKKQQRQLANQAVRLINTIFPEILFETREGCERYLPQAQHCAALIRDFQLGLKEGPLLLERLGSYCYQRGCYTEAKTHLVLALHLQEQHLPIDSLDTARTLNSLGLLYQRQARYQESEALHQRALEIREKALDQDHPEIAESLHNLAMLYGDKGEYQRAEQAYLRALALEGRAKGAEHPDVAKTLNNLGLIYAQQGRYVQAETAYQHALTIYEHSLPHDHPDLTYPLNNSGSLAEKRGNYQQAQEFYQRALVIREQVFGKTHPETAQSFNKLADIAESRGDYQQAEALYKQALEIGEQILGPQHPDVALFLNNLAFLASKQGHYRQAEQTYLRALDIYEQVYGPEHRLVASVLNNLGQTTRKIGNEERAEVILRQALAIRINILGATHPHTAQSMSNLADLLTEKHRYEEAEPLYQQALAIRQQTFGEEHPDVARTREKYAAFLEQKKSCQETAIPQQAVQEQEEQISQEPSQEDR